MINQLKRILKFLLPKTLVNYLYFVFRPYYAMELTDKQREKISGEYYYNAIHKNIDFKNPILFTEKIQWYKLYYYHPDLSRIVCKYNFKKYIAEKLQSDKYTIPLLGVWDDVEKINFESLPNKFVLKINCSFGGKNIKIIQNKNDINFEELKEEIRPWLDPKNTLINSLCRAYWDVKPLIIAEEYVEQFNNQLYDYKFFCFNGEPNYVYVATDHFSKDKSKITLSAISFYNMKWEKLNVRYGNHDNCDVEKPYYFAKMIEIAKKVSSDFPFVRVDFFETAEQIYISEMTFYPGTYSSTYSPIEFDREMGDKFVLPPKCRSGKKYRKDLHKSI